MADNRNFTLAIALTVDRDHLAIHVDLVEVSGNDFTHAHTCREKHLEQSDFPNSPSESGWIRAHFLAG